MIEKLPDIRKKFIKDEEMLLLAYYKLNEIIDILNKYSEAFAIVPQCDHKWKWTGDIASPVEICSICGCDKEA